MAGRIPPFLDAITIVLFAKIFLTWYTYIAQNNPRICMPPSEYSPKPDGPYKTTGKENDDSVGNTQPG
ncbi:hypothetical protein NC651_002212 [Populus alba x Populus x berolinensis]|nr:hypothetical protein NC651_002212 [Populus alba x Populus x berolinensis]